MPPASAFVIPARAPVLLPVAGSDLFFPVNRLFCIGRNYAEHAVEMGHDPEREPPFFFMKPASAIIPPGRPFACPPQSSDVHHEVELVMALSGGGRDIDEAEALDIVFGYAVGLDMTLRDVQAAAKAKQRPWDAAKAFDGSAPCSAIAPAALHGHPDRGAITLAIDGAMRQSSDLSRMIWPCAAIIAHLSRWFALEPGDLVFTGTPSGVGAVRPGERIEAAIEGVGTLRVDIAAA